MRPQTPRSPGLSPTDIPDFGTDDSFAVLVSKLIEYIARTVDAAYSYEQLRTTLVGQCLRPLVISLSDDCHNEAIVAALLTSRYIFSTLNEDDLKLNESRAMACELVAWQFLTSLSQVDIIEYLLYEVQPDQNDSNIQNDPGNDASETSPLLRSSAQHTQIHGPSDRSRLVRRNTRSRLSSHGDILVVEEAAVTDAMAGMNALEIAAVANAKKFLSQKIVQTCVDDIWSGRVIFWESLSTNAIKKPKIYNEHTSDPFSRLRVPKYQRAFQVAFFAAFLVLYYAVLVERNPHKVTATEILLYIWIAAFAYDEFGEIRDAGLMFYRIDFWSVWDLSLVLVGVAFFIARTIGLVKNNSYINDMAFDILSMAALFLVPRICSVASLNPYFGSLLPVLKEMTTAFCKFLPVIVILYLGFLTTFTMLARDRLTLSEVSWLLIKVFFGSSYLGFDVAVQISPIFGYTLMVIFVALTNILLLTALVSLVSNSLSEVMAHAREEYLFQYSIYVLESCTSRRLTYFLPPTNLLPLIFIRPLRLVLPSESVRGIRILLLRCISVPFVALIWIYEGTIRVLWRESGPPPLIRSRSKPSAYTPLVPGLSPSSTAELGPALKNSMRSSTQASDYAVQAPSSKALESNDLMDLVRKLSVQVDELTAIVSAQRND